MVYIHTYVIQRCQGFCPYVWVAVIEDGMNMSKIVLT